MSHGLRLPPLPRGAGRVLAALRQEAASRGETLALVGGTVRDALLRIPLNDIDLVVEGDATELARRVASRLRLPVRIHHRFSTATIGSAAGPRIDLASARSERYSRPAALPEIAGASLQEDLARRDFTINAMALRLDSRSNGLLLDPFGGRADLAARRLRILHSASFRDDPTRAFRAVEFEARFQGRLDRWSRGRLREALADGVFAHLSSDRLRAAVARLLGRTPLLPLTIRRLRDLGLDRTFIPRGVFGPWAGPALLRRLGEALVERQSAWGPEADFEGDIAWRAALLCLGLSTRAGGLEPLTTRLGLRGRAASWLTDGCKQVLDAARVLRAVELSLGDSDRCLRATQPLPRRALAVHPSPRVRRRVHAWRRRAATFQLRINGGALRQSGVAAERIGAALLATRRERLNRRLRAGEELRFAVRFARGENG